MVKRREFFSAIGAALYLTRGAVRANSDAFAEKTFRTPNGESVPYRLFVPRNYDQRDKYPLVLWLHGAGGRGNDNLKQISGGNAVGSHVWTWPENQTRQTCFVVAPQCPAGEMWANIQTARPTRQLALVHELLQYMLYAFNLDPQRLYVAGQSMGGFGAWALISQRPHLFAAAVPVCGGGDESEAHKLVRMPIWAFHGERDQTVGVERSRRMIEAVRRAGGTPTYTEYPGAPHGIWERAFREPNLLPWLFSQRKKTG